MIYHLNWKSYEESEKYNYQFEIITRFLRKCFVRIIVHWADTIIYKENKGFNNFLNWKEIKNIKRIIINLNFLLFTLKKCTNSTI